MKLASLGEAASVGLGARAAAIGWQQAWFEFNAERTRRGEPLAEDDRAADWTLLLRLKSDASVLVIGCEWATAALTLARRCSRVYATDGAAERVEFLKVRAAQQNVTNIETAAAPARLENRFAGGPFDLIVIRDVPEGWPTSLPILIEALKADLKPDGMLFMSVTNSWCPLFWLSRSVPSRIPTQSLIGCKRQLERAGFGHNKTYGPLPRHWGVSLFHVPLDRSEAVGFFFKKIFPLFEAVSPEVKRGFALEFALAKIAARAAGLPGAARLIKYFLPGFHVIAERNPKDRDAA